MKSAIQAWASVSPCNILSRAPGQFAPRNASAKENPMKKSRPHGFTLVEILIVVIILGILAAIVIPQFTNASNDARNNSVASTLQTLRGQIELYKIQHAD